MLNLREFRNQALSFPDLLNYALLVSDGIVQTKSGGLMSSWYFRGLDAACAAPEELATISNRLNNILGQLGEGWMLHVDAMRRPIYEYCEAGSFPDATSMLIDIERREQFLQEGAHFETIYALTLTYHPPNILQRRMMDFLYTKTSSQSENSAERILMHYQKTIQDIEQLLNGIFSIRRMGAIKENDEKEQSVIYDEQLQYLFYCISGQLQLIRLPSIPMYLDSIVGRHEFLGGSEPKINDHWLGLIALDGFPQESYPGILSKLDELALEYRWSTRFIFYEPYRARKLLSRIRRKWQQKQRGLKDQLFHTAKGPIDLDALNMTNEAELALSEAESGYVKYGQYTSIIVLHRNDKTVLQEDARLIIKTLMNLGFRARLESINAVEAYLGSLPGHHYPNIRRPLLHTLNLADLLPTTAIWAGLEHNPNPLHPEKSPPWCFAATAGSTPFRMSLHVDDLGHTLLLGKSGAGKSTALAFLMAQFLRYPNAQIFAFDKGYSASVLVEACGGILHEIGTNTELNFCPLQHLESEQDYAWSLSWLETLLQYQNMIITSKTTQTLQAALKRLQASNARSLTALQAQIQCLELRAALEPYTLNGPLGSLLDAEKENMKTSHFQVFELEHLLNFGEKYYVPVLLYLFHLIETKCDGRPTFVPIDEAWLALMVDVFRDKVGEWLRTWRKKNAVLLLATQNILDVINSPLRDLLLANCPTKIFLPHHDANTAIFRETYQTLGLNHWETALLSEATEKCHYYYTSPLGKRLFSFGFGEVALSFIGVNSQDRQQVQRLKEKHGPFWPAAWLQHQNLSKWATKWRETEHLPSNA